MNNVEFNDEKMPPLNGLAGPGGCESSGASVMIELEKINIDCGSAFHKSANLSVGDAYKSTLELTLEQIKDGPWEGFVVDSLGYLMALIVESDINPGYYHCRVMGRDSSETKRPVIAEAIGLMMDHLLSNHGRSCADLKWAKANVSPFPVKISPTRNSGEIVYFLRAGDFIKIGKATGTPDNRISQLKTGCPFPIEIAATMRGGYDEERGLHKRFAAFRAHGEWFHAVSEIISFIDTIKVTK